MNTRVSGKSRLAAEFLQLELWHGFANAAVVALFGMPMVNPTGSARAAWLEVSQLLVGLSPGTRTRKPGQRI
jgi:hypothetical protein